MATGRLDLLHYTGPLHHLSPFPKALAEAERGLARDGWLYISKPSA